LLARGDAGQDTRLVASAPNLTAPHVTYGRMLQPYWLKLQRTGDTFTGSISPDGQSWSEVGRIQWTAKAPLHAGLAACSALSTVTTRVMFDHVSAPGWTPPASNP